MVKLYKAVDKKDGVVSAFLVRDNGDVCKSSWLMDDKSEIDVAKQTCSTQTPSMNGMDDAINPVLIAEW